MQAEWLAGATAWVTLIEASRVVPLAWSSHDNPISNLQDPVPKVSSSVRQEALRMPRVQVVAPGLGKQLESQ